MTKHLKHLMVLLLLIVIGSMTLACTEQDNGLQYATFYDRVEKYAYETYMQDNSTRVPFTENDLRPFDIVNVIKTQSEFEYAIPDGHIEIDFSEEILVVYFFTDIYMGFNCALKSIKIENNQLKIVILHELADKIGQGPRPPSTSYPTQRCMAIKTTLTDFDSVSVSMTYPD